MGVARLAKVSIIAPRSEYTEVAKALAQFEDFHPMEGAPGSFDPGVQELTVRAVRLFAQADQAVKDLGLKLMPGQMDIVFRGVKVPQSTYEASDWGDLLGRAEAALGPMVEDVRSAKAQLQKAQKDESDAEAMRGALSVVSGISSDLSGFSDLRKFKGVMVIVMNEKLDELRNSIPGAIFVAHQVTKEQTLAMVVVPKDQEARLDKAIKLLDLKPISIPSNLPQNPAQAFNQAGKDLEAAVESRKEADARLQEVRSKHGTELLALRELTEVARRTLDEARVSGGLRRFAMIDGYIPSKKEAEFQKRFGKWMVHTEELEHGSEGDAPTLMQNKPGTGLYSLVTLEQGTPGRHEVDPTPLVSFVFPIFFGIMFGDVGHGLLLTGFMLFVRQRSVGTMRQWANIFLVAGISAIVFGILFGEFFELPFNQFVPIPPVLEIIHRAAGVQDSFNGANVYLIMEVAILIGVAHLITALSLDVYQAAKAHETGELLLEKIPVLTMYLSGVGYGLAFVGVGYSFNVLSSSAPAPLLGIPNNVLGELSLAVLVPSMLVLFAGKAVALGLGRIKDGSVVAALSNGGLEVFERITQFMSNTISYVRLAVMLLVHAALLLIINLMHPFANPILIAPWVVFNLLILLFEAFIVYVQDLRLHLYEFFTKFYGGTGKPFTKIFPDRARIRINWL